MDAADVPNPRRRNYDCRYLGVGDFMPWIATTSLLSRPRRGLRKHGERLQASLRQHLAFADFVNERLRAGGGDRLDHGRHHWMVQSCSLLGDALAEGRRPYSSYGMDSISHGSLSFQPLLADRSDRAGGLVPGHNAYGFWY